MKRTRQDSVRSPRIESKSASESIAGARGTTSPMILEAVHPALEWLEDTVGLTAARVECQPSVWFRATSQVPWTRKPASPSNEKPDTRDVALVLIPVQRRRRPGSERSDDAPCSDSVTSSRWADDRRRGLPVWACEVGM